MKTVYVAGASAEVDMVAGYMQRLREGGWTIVYDWTVDVLSNRALGVKDSDLSELDASRYAENDMAAVRRSDAFWLLIPEANSIGCWLEFGMALAVPCHHIVVSGNKRRSIFTVCHDVWFAAHDEALECFLAEGASDGFAR